jgi:DNA-binding MarR family transcriptional regulator
MHKRFPDQPDFVGRLIRDAFELFIDEIQQRLAPHYPDVTRSHHRVMVVIGPDGTRPSELARMLQVSRQTMQETLAGMVRLDLVTLEPDPHDRRAKVVKLTDFGWDAMRTGLQAALDVHREWESVLGEPAMKRLMTLLRRLVDGVAAAR